MCVCVCVCLVGGGGWWCVRGIFVSVIAVLMSNTMNKYQYNKTPLKLAAKYACSCRKSKCTIAKDCCFMTINAVKYLDMVLKYFTSKIFHSNCYLSNDQLNRARHSQNLLSI